MKNTLLDLNNHLFEQLERLNDEDLKGEALQEEIKKSQAITSVAREIVSNGNLVLKARIVASEAPDGGTYPKMLGAGE